MRIVITGASGNIGTALLRRLSADGGAEAPEIVGVARRMPPADEAPYSIARWRSIDLTAADAPALLRRSMAGADAVVHLAWGFQPSHDIDYLRRLDVEGTRLVAAASAETGVPHLIHMSSVGAYRAAAGDDRVDESYPVDGIPTLAYSIHKAAAEALLEGHEKRFASQVVTRLRPGIVVQRAAGSALLRYGLPAYVPAPRLRALPLLPVDRSLRIPIVHADDVASAIVAALERRAGGPFNLAADEPIRRDDIAEALGARPVHVPSRVLGAVAAAAWHARLQPLDPGWIDLAFSVPLLDTSRARDVLGWAPSVEPRAALREVVDGMADAAHTGSPVLARRSALAQARKLVVRGPIGNRRVP
jgi:UDP-glucose 4-epimerase